LGLGAASAAAQYVVTHPQPSHNPVNLDFLLDPLSKSEFLSFYNSRSPGTTISGSRVKSSLRFLMLFVFLHGPLIIENALLEYLKSKLQRVEVKGSRHNFNQYTCGQLHDRRNPEWRKLENCWKYCGEAEFEPYAAIDAIEERIGVKLECDWQIINNEIENRRKTLANVFGADLGEPGRDYDFF